MHYYANIYYIIYAACSVYRSYLEQHERGDSWSRDAEWRNRRRTIIIRKTEGGSLKCWRKMLNKKNSTPYTFPTWMKIANEGNQCAHRIRNSNIKKMKNIIERAEEWEWKRAEKKNSKCHVQGAFLNESIQRQIINYVHCVNNDFQSEKKRAHQVIFVLESCFSIFGEVFCERISQNFKRTKYIPAVFSRKKKWRILITLYSYRIFGYNRFTTIWMMHSQRPNR